MEIRLKVSIFYLQMFCLPLRSSDCADYTLPNNLRESTTEDNGRRELAQHGVLPSSVGGGEYSPGGWIYGLYAGPDGTYVCFGRSCSAASFGIFQLLLLSITDHCYLCNHTLAGPFLQQTHVFSLESTAQRSKAIGLTLIGVSSNFAGRENDH
jgi:hypothetical protein